MLLNLLFKKLLKDAVNHSLKQTQSYTLHPIRFYGTHTTNQQKDSIFTVFKAYGFSETQISNFVTRNSKLLSCHPDKTVKPKLDYFRSIGFTTNDLEILFIKDPEIMRRSLDNQIRASCQFLKSVLKDDGEVVMALKRSSWLLKADLSRVIGPNIGLLRECGVSDDRIKAMLRWQPRTFIQSKERFRLLVEEVKGLGFDPVKHHFITGLQILVSLSKDTFERKREFFRKWGWSDEEIVSAFRRQPQCMGVSEEKMERVMDFLVNEMGWDSSKVAACPSVVMHSIEKWTVPRCLVVQFLISKGVLKDTVTLASFIVIVEKKFVERFVVKYSSQFPEVINLYGTQKGDMQKLKVA